MLLSIQKYGQGLHDYISKCSTRHGKVFRLSYVGCRLCQPNFTGDGCSFLTAVDKNLDNKATKHESSMPGRRHELLPGPMSAARVAGPASGGRCSGPGSDRRPVPDVLPKTYACSSSGTRVKHSVAWHYTQQPIVLSAALCQECLDRSPRTTPVPCWRRCMDPASGRAQ